jgi:TetR/AcrR family transcriptional repressor of nem operon
MPMRKQQADSPTRDKLLDAAQELMLTKGYVATSVDEVCQAAGLTKGSFFHYFPGKEDLGIAVAQRFAERKRQVFEAAPFRRREGPLDRVLGHVDFLIEMIRSPLASKGCLLGTFVQELSQTHPNIRATCAACFEAGVADLERDLEQARAKHAPQATWSARSLAEHLLAVVQGAIILAKAKQDTRVIQESLEHFKRYLQALFAV